MKKKALILGLTIACAGIFTIQPFSPVNGVAKNIAFASKQDSYSKQNYAVMAYLVYTKQDLNNIQDNSVSIKQNGNHFQIDNQNGENIVIKVNSNNVILKVTDQNSKEKAHTYSKSQLTKRFKGQKEKLTAIVQSGSEEVNNTSSSQAISSNNNNIQSSNNQNIDNSQNNSNGEKVYTARTSSGHIIYQTNNAGHFEGDPDTIEQTHDLMEQAAQRIQNGQQ